MDNAPATTAPAPGLGRLTAALVQAQRQFQPAIKEAINPHFRSRYVDLAGVINSCREALGANGLAVVQTTAITESGTVLRSILLHTSGEQIASEYPLVPVKNDPQGMGSAVTYARRYSLMALLGIAAEDDDGERGHDRQHGGRDDRAPGSKPSTQAAPQGNGQAPREQSAPVATAPTSTSPKASPTRVDSATTDGAPSDLRQAKANFEQVRASLPQGAKPLSSPEDQKRISTAFNRAASATSRDEALECITVIAGDGVVKPAQVPAGKVQELIDALDRLAGIEVEG